MSGRVYVQKRVKLVFVTLHFHCVCVPLADFGCRQLHGVHAAQCCVGIWRELRDGGQLQKRQHFPSRWANYARLPSRNAVASPDSVSVC